MDKGKIINALATIQDVCNNNPCDGCPFGNDAGECLISVYSPIEWELNREDAPWRALLYNAY